MSLGFGSARRRGRVVYLDPAVAKFASALRSLATSAETYMQYDSDSREGGRAYADLQIEVDAALKLLKETE